MQLLESIRIALRALAANKLRSVLTMLGIIIGVGAVIVLISLGRGVERFVTDSFAGLGSNLLFVAGGGLDGQPTGSAPKPITLDDATALSDPSRVPDVRAVTAEYTGGGVVDHGTESKNAQVQAVMPNYRDVRSWDIAEGEFFTQADFEERARVAVLGQTVYRDLFEPNEYAIDQTVRINNLNFRVIGVMEGIGGLGGDQDNTVLVPLSTGQERIFRARTLSGDYIVSIIYASVIEADRIDAARDQIAEVLRDRRNVTYLDNDNFTIISQTDVISVFGDILGLLTLFLGAIAGISLLVGGIGIMNIMLVSVTERTREIGLRKAVGAKRRDVLLQFLIEAVTLSLVGGLIGVGLGWVGSVAAGQLSENFNASVGMDAVLIAVLFSMAVGLFFGIYPAFQASRLNPIDALRYE